MKKDLYVKPEIVVVELETESVLASSPVSIERADIGTSETGESDAQGRRGSGWGSLWE